MAGQLQLQLDSPAGNRPAIFNWPLLQTESYDEGMDIAEMIQIILNDVYKDEPLGRGKDKVVPPDLKTDDYDEMKDMCDRFNKVIAPLVSWRDGLPEQPPPKQASKEAVKNIMHKIYNQSIRNPERLNKYASFSPGTYGETGFEVVQEMLERIELDPTGTAIDLGSGVGQVVLHIAATVVLAKVYGIELQDIPNSYAKVMSKNFRFWMEWGGFRYSPYELIEGNFMDNEHRQSINRADLVFANNVAFGPKLNFQLKQIFLDQKPGSHIVSSQLFVPIDFERVTERNKDSLEVYLDTKSVAPIVGRVSWTDTPLTYHVQIYDVTLAFARRQKFAEDRKQESKHKRRNNGNNREEIDPLLLDEASRTSMAASSSGDSDVTKEDPLAVEGGLVAGLAKLDVKVKLVDISPKAKVKAKPGSPAAPTIASTSNDGGKKRNRRKAAIAGAVKTAAASANLDFANDNGVRRSRGRPRNEESDGPMMRAGRETKVKAGKNATKVNPAGLAALETLHANTVKSYSETDQRTPGLGCIDERLRCTVEAARLEISLPLKNIRLKNHPNLNAEPKQDTFPGIVDGYVRQVKKENEEGVEAGMDAKAYLSQYEEHYERFAKANKERLYQVYKSVTSLRGDPCRIRSLEMRVKRARFEQDVLSNKIKTLTDGNKSLMETIEKKLNDQIVKRRLPAECATSLKEILAVTRNLARENQLIQKVKEKEAAKLKALEAIVLPKLRPWQDVLKEMVKDGLGHKLSGEPAGGIHEGLLAKEMQDRLKLNEEEAKKIEQWLELREEMDRKKRMEKERIVVYAPEVACMPPPPAPPPPPPIINAHTYPRLDVPQMVMPDFHNFNEGSEFAPRVGNPKPFARPTPPPPPAATSPQKKKAKKRSSAEIAAASSLELLAGPQFAPRAHQQHHPPGPLPPPPPAHSTYKAPKYSKALDLGKTREENFPRAMKQEVLLMPEHQLLPNGKAAGLPTQAAYSEDRVQSIITRCLNDSTRSAEETLESQVPVGLLMSAPSAPVQRPVSASPVPAQNFAYPAPVTTSPTSRASSSFFSPAKWAKTAALDYSSVSPTKLALRGHGQMSPMPPTVGDLVTSEVEKTLEISSQSIIDLAIDRSYKKPVEPSTAIMAPTPASSVAVEGLAACLMSNQPQKQEPAEQEYSFKHLDKRMRYQMSKSLVSAVPCVTPSISRPVHEPPLAASSPVLLPAQAAPQPDGGLNMDRDSSGDDFDKKFDDVYNFARVSVEEAIQRREKEKAAQAPMAPPAMAPPPPSDATSGDDSCSSFSSSSAYLNSSSIVLPKKKRLLTNYVTNVGAFGGLDDSNGYYQEPPAGQSK